MDEPTYARESRFWDQVTDWLLGEHDLEGGPLSKEEIHALLKDAHRHE